MSVTLKPHAIYTRQLGHLFQSQTSSRVFPLQCPSLEDCQQTCASDSLDCYLLDDSGFVLVSKRREETGKFFGDVDGTVMDALLQHNVYHKVLMFDYQGVCLDVISTGSSAWTLLTVSLNPAHGKSEPCSQRV